MCGLPLQMKKSFPLRSTNKATERLLDAIKHEVRKYVKRERNKALPATFDTWEFDCRVGADEASAQPALLPNISSAIDGIATSGSESVYVEVIARPGHRVVKARSPNEATRAPSEPTTGEALS